MLCPRCKSTETKEILTPELSHYGKIVCANCGCFQSWMPTPVTPLESVHFPAATKETPLTALKGSNPQISWAESLRPAMLAAAANMLPEAASSAMRLIAEASWWIANRDCDPTTFKWPKEWLQAPTQHAAPPEDPTPSGITHKKQLVQFKHWKLGTLVNIKNVRRVIEDIALVRIDDGTMRLIFFDGAGNAFYEATQVPYRGDDCRAAQ